ncbi:ATP-binding response regulator [Salinimicrobium sp. GXAS 041]|uniref:hybrid sensor histidine kinase/response regulator n=1 Tax=Salinimicrobium sp. GXAS 041 TaxID=3400806 RepID=UPI003C713D5D
MKENKQSITFTVIAGYLLLTTLAGFAVWFIYSQVIDYTSMAENNLSSNKRLLLVGQAATNLYEAESLSRQLIQSGEPEKLKAYKAQIDSIRIILDSLAQTSADTDLSQEVDSINLLLSLKIANLEELLELREREGNQSYYSRVISELQRVDENFGSRDYDERFKDLAPHQRRVLVKLLQYSERDNAQQITTQTLDSLVQSVKTVLSELELADRRFRRTVRATEDQLLVNEVNLNSQLRNLLTAIEAEERSISLTQVAERQEIVRSTSRTIGILGATSFAVILIFLFLVMRDVTRSYQYRNQLEAAKQYAESLLKSREQFMATVTHDLRSPLNTVVGYTDLLERTKLSRSQSHYLNHLKKSSDYILHLVDDLLDLSRLEAGKMTVEYLSFNPKNLIEDTVENAVPLQKCQEVAIIINISEELDRRVKSDPFRIKQVITNLVTNACKFTEVGSIEIDAFFDTQNRKKILVIKVKDTGIGISEEKKEAIFEEFSQENSSIEKKYGGSGLGLAISKKITQLLKGSIELDSEHGKGSEFTVKIPVQFVEEKEIEPSTTPEQPKEEMSRFSVLIVDDEPAQLSLLSEFIKTTGMSIETSSNGKEAKKKLEKQHFDLVLTDIQMPKMSGTELLSFIRKNPETKNIPVLALSGQATKTSREYLKMGFNGSLLKPYSSSLLLQKIENVLQTELKKPSAKLESNISSQNYSFEEVELFAGGDKQALNTILRAFIESTQVNLQALNQAQVKRNKTKIAAIAHKMLPMFRQLKVKNVIGQLEILESSNCEKYGEVNIHELTAQINNLLQEIKEEIKD